MNRDAVAHEVSPEDYRGMKSMPAGAYLFFSWYGESEIAGITHGCPCGCGIRTNLFLRGYGKGHDEWDVQGEWPKVTLHPSIGISRQSDGRWHWHGYLKNGVFVER